MISVIYLPTVTSTNNELKKIKADQQPHHFTVLVASNQTGGRGQAGTTWESEPGKNLTFSILFYPEGLLLKESFILTEWLAITLRETLKNYIEDVTIKWPNDIYYMHKKICGTLIENEIINGFISDSIAGIGININQEIFTSDAPNPVSLKQITGKEYDLMEIFETFIWNLEKTYSYLKEKNWDKIHDMYRQNLYRKNGIHQFYDMKEHKLLEASLEEVRYDGTLVLKTGEGQLKPYLFKEVQYIF